MRVERQVSNKPLNCRPFTHGELASMTTLDGFGKVRFLSGTKQGGKCFFACTANTSRNQPRTLNAKFNVQVVQTIREQGLTKTHNLSPGLKQLISALVLLP